MTRTRIVTAVGLVAALLVLPSLADAQTRGRAYTGRAVPRSGPPPHVNGGYPPHGGQYPYRGGVYYPPYYRSPYYYGYVGFPRYYGPYSVGYAFGYPTWSVSVGFGFGYPYGYGYAGYGYAGYGYPYYGYPAYPYPAYGYYAAPGRPYGGIRIDVPQRDAEVYVDGAFGGVVDNYDGTFQQLNLEPGMHRIEIRAPGFSGVSFEVNIDPGRTITYRTSLRPAP